MCNIHLFVTFKDKFDYVDVKLVLAFFTQLISRSMKKNVFLLACFLLLLPFLTLAQNSSWESINWHLNKKADGKRLLSFDGAIHQADRLSLPFYQKRCNLPENKAIERIRLSNSVFVPLDSTELAAIDPIDLKKISHTLTFDINTVWERKQAYGSYGFVPLVYDTTDNTFKKLLLYQLDIEYADEALTYQKSATLKNQSVLASGDWYKIRVNETGIYRLTYSELEQMGVDVASVDPRNLRLYGNGAGMLPESTDEPVLTDLHENSIIVVGESDGVFNPGDYILFYGQSPVKWEYQELSQSFRHKVNIYDDYTYYFITSDLGPGKRIGQQNPASDEADQFINTFNDYSYHEVDEVNLIGTGRKWYENAFELNSDFQFELEVPGLVTTEEVVLRTALLARSEIDSYFKVYADDDLLGNVYIDRVYNSSNEDYAKEGSLLDTYFPVSSKIDILIEYNETTTSSKGWLDYVELSYTRDLIFTGSQMPFRSVQTLGNPDIAEFRIGNPVDGLRIWNVSDPFNVKEVNGQLQSGAYKFILETGSLLEFIAFDESAYKQEEFVEKVDNQNLHAISNVEFVIVSHPDFLTEAERLAQFHRVQDDMPTEVVTTEQVFNEFASGAQDVSAIRNFMKHIYDQSDPGSEPSYLLLFGDASYDYKDRVEDNTNYVLSWESSESLSSLRSYVTDDFFAKLDGGEGYASNGNLDIGVGRIPVFTKSQAVAAVDKIEHYASFSAKVMKPWRNYVCFVADDEDGNLHVQQAEQLAEFVETNVKDLNIDKIYLDSYEQESTPSGQRYPAAHAAVNERVEKGALVLNYTGHGGELGLAHEQILNNSDIQGWRNLDNMPVFITATCEFSRFDDPKRTAAGEYVILNPNGGAIAMFTTTRATFASPNLTLNKKFYKYAFKKINGEYPRLGDILRLSKNETGANEANVKKYALLGDPALRIAYPKDSVAVLKINDYQVNELSDTLKALARVNMEGSIYDCAGNKLTAYNGILFTTVFDKASEITTRGQDDHSFPMKYHLYKNVIYNGKVPIENGDFSLTFMVPKDIAYKFGYGRISFYARDDNGDATGYFEDIIVGGYNDDAVQDLAGPEVDLYMNDTNFLNGGYTGENPILLAKVHDENGINTVGNGIGHDIVAVLNGKSDDPFILNDYYESDLGDYRSGSVEYPLFDLEEGRHTIYLKIWDVFNNSSDASIDFVVAPTSDFIVENIMNYPNPFFDETSFMFEHNMAGQEIDVTIYIFSMQGKLVQELSTRVMSPGYTSTPLSWNGNSTNGSRLPRGMYIYRISAQTQDGRKAENNGKLIILNR